MKISEIWSKKGHMFRKLWLNQFAFSLFGIFVATPFNGNICIIAGCFSLLFYMFTVGYAILDDAQKDRISHNAGRGENLNSSLGFIYSFLSFVPTLVISATFTISTFIFNAENTFRFIIGLLVKYLFAGEILGIDVGLTKYTFDAEKLIRISGASDFVLFLSDHGLIQLVFALIVPAVFGLIYNLAFKGVISVDTTEGKSRE